MIVARGFEPLEGEAIYFLLSFLSARRADEPISKKKRRQEKVPSFALVSSLWDH